MTDTPKAALITGAGSGMGAATARRLVRDGWTVTLLGRRPDALESTAATLAPNQSLVVPTDVADRAAVADAIAAHMERWGRLDGLVNAAGVAVGGPITEVAPEDWRRVIAVNLDGLYHTISQSVPHLVAVKGAVVNISSVSGLGGDWGFSPYNASKGAVSNFTRALALELGMQGVRVNAVAPSLTRTDMAEFVWQNEALVDQFRNRLPLGRIAEPEEIASVVAFLLSEDASFVNGVNLPVDGGVSASNGQPNLF